ncbi:MAG: hypothetical protein O3A00_00205 [Planctomycetota bacterium]|nr:hypothetical protein [Planctomycetota bacterium]
MKRTIPLLITGIGGFVLILAFFIPYTESWGEVAAVWFDVMAAIAFLLGGGNLMKVHLKKISDRAAGWAYSLIVLLAFLLTLWTGLFKTGSKPADNQEYYGESFASLSVADLPDSMLAEIEGSLPEKVDAELPPSVRRQLSVENGKLRFRGWMTDDHVSDLKSYHETLEWQCKVETLAAAAKPPEVLSGKVSYHSDHQVLSFHGYMSDAEHTALVALGKSAAWSQAVKILFDASRVETRIKSEEIPKGYQLPESVKNVQVSNGELVIQGPMSAALRDQVAAGQATVPFVRPMTKEQRAAFRREIESKGQPLTGEQAVALETTFNTVWTSVQLRLALVTAGQPSEVPKTACEMLIEQQAGVQDIKPKRIVGTAVGINDAQGAVLAKFSTDPSVSIDQAVEQLRAAGEFNDAQEKGLKKFLDRVPNQIDFDKSVATALNGAGPLAEEQKEFLLGDYRKRFLWRRDVGRLFVASHVPKYEWSGDYAEQGTGFWFAYEYAMKPLTATMFAMLAFYVASAAFRAFRAKNIEASLLLGTAFIILLGRTQAGVILTAWFPDAIGGLRIDSLTVYIMSVFNTAGNRAIMIGIALGIASTSLKVLLGMDRSYLGND